MGFWANYKPEDYDTVFDCSDGDHTLTIVKVEPKQSKNNNDMIEVSFKVDNIGVYYVERYTDNEYFNKIITRFFDAFGIPRGNFTFKSWFGKQAQGHFIHKEETYTGKDGQQKTINKARLQYLAVPDKESNGYESYQSAAEDAPSEPTAQETAGASAAFDKKTAKPSPMTKETADELNKMFESGQFTQEEAIAYYALYHNGEVAADALLWKVRKEYTTRLNKNNDKAQNEMPIF
jgi:hypothetical protein